MLFFPIWSVILVAAIMTDNLIWWNNMSIVCFMPYYFVGLWFNQMNMDRAYTLKWVLFLLCCIYLLSTVVFYLGLSKLITVIISEIRKLMLAFMGGTAIFFVDQSELLENVNPSFGLYDIGEMSFTIYALHGPVIIWLMGWGMDIISIIIILAGLSCVGYTVIEERASKILLQVFSQIKP